MNSLTGLVICGGNSARMGYDKGLIIYRGKPQWLHVAEMLEKICGAVSICCNPSQIDQFQGEFALLVDDPEYADHGPMSALLTAFKAHPEDSFLFVGVDYPLLASDDLKNLLDAREPGVNAVCMYHDDAKMEEPLVAVYENEIWNALVTQFSSGDFSLRRLLQKSNAKRVFPLAAENLRSSDTPEEAQQIINSIK